MADPRTCIDCGVPLVYEVRGRPPLRCGECKRGRRRVKTRAPIVCVDCGAVFTPPGQTGAPPKRCATCWEADRRRGAKQRMETWRARNPEKAKEAYRRADLKYRVKPGAVQAKRDRNRQRLYGLAPADFAALLAGQDGKCAICRGEPTARNFHVDHCHTSGRVRGLLCHHCNTMLGLAADDPARLLAAVQYLTKT